MKLFQLFTKLNETFPQDISFSMDDIISTIGEGHDRALIRGNIKTLTDRGLMTRLYKNCYIMSGMNWNESGLAAARSIGRKRTPDEKEPVHAQGPPSHSENGFKHLFKGHEDVYNSLIEEAKLDFRTPVEELRYFVWKGCWERRQTRNYKLRRYAEDKKAYDEASKPLDG